METAQTITVMHQVAALAGYLAGSIPFGLILTRFAGYGDVRAIGSGNIGATNVLRTGNKVLAFATLILDGGKGAVAVLILGQWGTDFALLAGLFAVIGHNFPVWLKFRGGKGVATTLGTVLALAWPVGLAMCALWLAMAVVLRYSSLSALTALAAMPFLMLWLKDARYAVIGALLAILGFVRHHDNIRRLLKGEETKIGSKNKSKGTGEDNA